MAPVIANPDQQVWAMILKNFAHIIPQDTSIKNNEKGYVIMNKIVVIGGGTMGLDIAQVFAKKGMDVVVRDIKDEILDASKARLNKGLDKLVSKGKMDEAGKAALLGKITFTTDLNAAADADLIISASPRPFWPPTPLPSPSPPSPPPPSAPISSSGCTSSTPPPS